MHYKLDYALRICSHNNRTQSCVHIYSQMGLYEEAVDLALEVSTFGNVFSGATCHDSKVYSIETWI